MKDFVLDTNVILHDSNAIFKFEENNVLIPMTVVEELDHFKKEMNELGRNARFFSKKIDELRAQGSVAEGVLVNNKGGLLRVVMCCAESLTHLPPEMDHNLPDNRILAVALHNQSHSENKTVLVSKDTNMRIKADALELPAENYNNDKVEVESLYTGILYVANEAEIPAQEYLQPNQYVVVKDACTGLITKEGRYDKGLGEIVPLRDDLTSWGLEPVNDEQRYLMDLLLNDDIKLVTAVGIAGAGKTLVALACALRKVTDDFVYRKLLVSRPVMPMGKDIGYLPGDIGEKLSPYIQPIRDNVEFLVSGSAPTVKLAGKKRGKKVREEEEKEAGLLGNGYSELEAAGIMEIEPLLYIRGRSIPNVVMIVDEAQNLSAHEVKTIITRAGKGTKLIFTGDIEQIDAPYLDASSNGLTYLIDKFQDQKIAGHITLVKGERSELAEIATQIL